MRSGKLQPPPLDQRYKNYGGRLIRCLLEAGGSTVPYVDIMIALELPYSTETNWTVAKTQISRLKGVVNDNKYVKEFGTIRVDHGFGLYFLAHVGRESVTHQPPKPKDHNRRGTSG